jgi:hypothetical protein
MAGSCARPSSFRGSEFTIIRFSSSPNTLCWPKTYVRSKVGQHLYPGLHCYPREQVANFLAAHGLKLERYEP